MGDGGTRKSFLLSLAVNLKALQRKGSRKKTIRRHHGLLSAPEPELIPWVTSLRRRDTAGQGRRGVWCRNATVFLEHSRLSGRFQGRGRGTERPADENRGRAGGVLGESTRSLKARTPRVIAWGSSQAVAHLSPRGGGSIPTPHVRKLRPAEVETYLRSPEGLTPAPRWLGELLSSFVPWGTGGPATRASVADLSVWEQPWTP